MKFFGAFEARFHQYSHQSIKKEKLQIFVEVYLV